MDISAKVAYILAQTALLNAELALMQAANQQRIEQGYALAYDDNAFAELMERYNCLSHNSVLEYLRD